MASLNRMDTPCPRCKETKLINIFANWHSFVYCEWCGEKYSTDQFTVLDMEAVKSKPDHSVEYINSILKQK